MNKKKLPRLSDKLPRLSDSLRAAVSDSGQSLYRVSKDSGVPYATLHRFMAGKRAVSMEALELLCDFLGSGAHCELDGKLRLAGWFFIHHTSPLIACSNSHCASFASVASSTWGSMSARVLRISSKS